MPDSVRSQVLDRVAAQTRRSGADLDVESVWDEFMQALSEVKPGDEPMRWQITRILDPELTPPPGRKASDRGTDAEIQDRGPGARKRPRRRA